MASPATLLLQVIYSSRAQLPNHLQQFVFGAHTACASARWLCCTVLPLCCPCLCQRSPVVRQPPGGELKSLQANEYFDGHEHGYRFHGPSWSQPNDLPGANKREGGNACLFASSCQLLMRPRELNINVHGHRRRACTNKQYQGTRHTSNGVYLGIPAKHLTAQRRSPSTRMRILAIGISRVVRAFQGSPNVRAYEVAHQPKVSSRADVRSVMPAGARIEECMCAASPCFSHFAVRGHHPIRANCR
jgi:hypothetical protein